MRYAAERRNLDESIEELSQIADSRNDILAEAAGITAGSWYASPATHVGYELIGAGMLIVAGGGHGFRYAGVACSVGNDRAPGILPGLFSSITVRWSKFPLRADGRQHDVRPCEQLGDRGCDIWETLRVDHSRSVWPDDAHHGGHRVWLDELDLQLVVVEEGGRRAEESGPPQGPSKRR
jgi:hypothetical protein